MACISYNSSTSSEIQVAPKSFCVGWARWILVGNIATNTYLTTEESHKDVFNKCPTGPDLDFFFAKIMQNFILMQST